ncbi:helix-turn-helix domain-containing protein [Streptomyces sp. GMY02]|uniref:helix-turn-helix domain-containing protein n=1 Tax=Streptomyces sp. GMY02 TaxID=1333528 RepID=UPI001C2BF684|nr:helix-turn-helix domain-containing protein [Streptomyces sp. GMY02]QXE37132.1 helix-turn-helix domain-containing protein [Streptomyces sp. GMY02]
MRVHRNRHDRAFVVVPNAAARHRGLSLSARGLLVTLLSLPDGTRATVDTVTDQVEEGRRAVAKAFTALEKAGYLRRERGQDPGTGLWGTQTHISDLPMDCIPAVGAPKSRSVGDFPKEEKNREKDLLPEPRPHGEEAAPPRTEEEGDASDDNDHPVTARAAATLAQLGDADRRLALSTSEVLRLAPLAAAWLAEGHSAMKIVAALTTRLPECVDSAAALISYRLKNQMPAKPAPKALPAPDTRHRCQSCDAVFPAGVTQDLCKLCRAEMERATAHILGTPAPAAEDQSAPISGEAAGLIAAIRQRRASATATHRRHGRPAFAAA